MRNRIMKKHRSLHLSVRVFIVFGLLIIAGAFCLTAKNFVPEKIAYFSYITAIPEAAISEISSLKADLYSFFFNMKDTDDGLLFIQKSNDTENDEYEEIIREDVSDLSITPDDILEKIASTTKNGQDGIIIEKTFYDDQSTDSSGNIFLRNVTDGTQIDIEKIIEAELDMDISDCSEPTVLIYHTHTTETYIMNDDGKFSTEKLSRSDDKSVNMVRIGDEIERILKLRGIGVIHDKNIYDSVYTGAYAKSREAVTAALKKYPSVKITLDIHRDAIYYDDYTGVKPIIEINGKKAAQMMIIAGAQGGNTGDFPNWQTNLKFAIDLQKTVNDKYEYLMKPIFFCNRKYNMDLTGYSLLIEVGTDLNTLEEAAYSGRMLGDALADLITKEGKTEK